MLLFVTFWAGVLASCVITLRRGQRAITERVEARGGRPIDDIEVWARLAWVVVKSLFWPINVAAWLYLDKPEPGTYLRPASPSTRSAPSDRSPAIWWTTEPDGAPGPRSAERTVPPRQPEAGGAMAPAAPSEAPRFPTAPRPAGAPEVAAVDRPASTVAPPVPRAVGGAPQLDQDYAQQLLRRAAFPETPHNVFAVQERLGILFSVKAKQLIDAVGTETEWRRFLQRAAYPRAQMHAWPQDVLNAIACWNASTVSELQDFPERYSAILLENLGSDSGFFGSAPALPLQTATDWHMASIAQSSARLLPAPR